jgi:phage FluMu gp28-like protein
MNAKANDDPRERNDVLLPYQIRWLADESPIKVAEKSRRIGLTWTEAAASALAASASKGMDTWYLGYNRDMALEFVETAAAWSRQFNKAAREIEEIAIDDERRDLLAYRIRFSSGHKIVALSCAALEPARQTGPRRHRRSRFPRRPQGSAQGRARLHHVGRMRPRDVHP